MKKEAAQLTAQLSAFKTLKDGGYRITLDFGQDSLDSVQKIIKWNSVGDTNFAVVLVPYKDKPQNQIDDNQIETKEIMQDINKNAKL